MTAPAGLRWRIIATLDAEDRAATRVTRRRGHALLWSSALAAAALTLVLARIPGSADHDMPGIMMSFVDQARLDLHSEGSLASSDPSELGSWLEAQVGYPVSVPAITNAVLLGGRVAELNKVSAAAVLYSLDGTRLTYFALPGTVGSGGDIPSEGVQSVSTGEFNLAIWAEAGEHRAVVSAMNERAVVAVAKECKRNSSGP